MCGALAGPKDIPLSVMEASAAACAAAGKLSSARGSLAQEQEFPEERPVAGDVPRVGVFVCSCGINIAGVVDVEAVAEYARSLPYVTYVEQQPVHLLPGHPGQDGRGDRRGGAEPGGGGGLHPAHPRAPVPGDPGQAPG